LYTAECENIEKYKDNNKYSRGTFVVGSEAVIASGAHLVITLTSSFAAVDAPKIYPPYRGSFLIYETAFLRNAL
jgi:hypothetical protein